MIDLRIHVGPLDGGGLSRADQLSMLRGQIKLLQRQFEENLPLTSGALARAERIARSLELDEVAP